MAMAVEMATKMAMEMAKASEAPKGRSFRLRSLRPLKPQFQALSDILISPPHVCPFFYSIAFVLVVQRDHNNYRVHLFPNCEINSKVNSRTSCTRFKLLYVCKCSLKYVDLDIEKLLAMKSCKVYQVLKFE